MMNKWPPDRVPRTFFAEEQFVARARELRSVIDRASVPVSNAAISPPTGAPVGSASPAHEAFGSASPAHEAFGERRPASDATWSPLRDGDELFSAPDEVRSIRFTVTVPDDWSMHGETTPFLALRFGHGGPNPGLPSFLTPATVPEAMVTIDGEPWHGLDGNHRLVSLPPALSHPGSTCTVTLKAWSGNGPAPSQSPMVWSCPRLVQIDRDVEGFAYDLEACAATVRALPPTELHRALFIEVGLHAIGLVDWNHPGSPDFRASVRAARQAFAERRPRVPAVSADMVPMVSHVGHTHLDVAWLWTTEQVKGKTARSWASALRLMDEFPTFRWLQSQPQLYAYIRETEPHLWTQVKARVADGRWEPEGGMWVEADCNLPSGESLVRQFVYGTRFFRQEFGRECTLLWLPDVFGYSWALPQIMAKCGIRWFMTTKLSWSQFNRFPYDTFQWRGIDGTEVLTHFVTTPDPGQDLGRTWTATYNGQILPDTVKGNWDAYQQKDLNPNTLSSFGWGDGGGGPTRDDMEHASRLADMPGIPRVQIESAQDFFARLEARVGTDPRTPVWDGELYFEYHRGTYTSQANQKRWNRRAEGALQEAELFATIAWCQSEYAYPRHELDAAWEIVLRNQFHDIIPGSSIRAVYEDSAREYAQAFALIRRVRDEAIGAVLAAHSLERASAADATAIIVTNATGFARAELVACPDVPAGLVPALPDGRPVPHQYDSDGTLLAWLPDVPASGLRRFQLVARRSFEGVEAPRVLGAHHAVPETSDTALHLADQDSSEMQVGTRSVVTPFWTVSFDEVGRMTRLFDRRNQREVIPAGAYANAFVTYEDKPLAFDAWDIDIFHQDKPQGVTDLVDAAVVEAGPERGVIRFVWRVAQSTISQRVVFLARDPRIDFVTEVDWQHRQTLLTVQFPVLVRSTRATFAIQFGNVERPTHANTSWDWARFETCAHQWADLSEAGYGVTLLNDSKYGHQVRGNVMRLTLLKSAIMPDPEADRGHHAFTYALLPHAGSLHEAGAVSQGARLNLPVQVVAVRAANGAPGGAGRRDADDGPNGSFVRCDAPHVVVETVKSAEPDGVGSEARSDGSLARGTVTVRAYDVEGRRGRARLTFARPVVRAWSANLLERVATPLACEGASVTVEIAPFAVVTVVAMLA